MFEDIWKALASEAATGVANGSIVRRRIFPKERPNIFLAVERPNNARLLLIDLCSDAIPHAQQLPTGEGFSVELVALPETGSHLATLALRLTDARYSEIFTVLVEDVVDAAVRTPNDNRMVDQFIARLFAWQRFLASHGPDGLSREAQQGLYGELHCLRTTVLPALDADSAVKAWTGPSGAVHDFQRPQCAVEVKTSSGKQLQVIWISNERQLDTAHVADLWLSHVSLDISMADGESLNDIVASLRESLAAHDLARQALDDHLWQAGYLDEHADRYETAKYNIRAYRVFHVRDGFPRIVESDLRPGIGDVHYAVSVAECMHYVANDLMVAESLRGE
jgi:hypothetical protein